MNHHFVGYGNNVHHSNSQAYRVAHNIVQSGTWEQVFPHERPEKATRRGRAATRHLDEMSAFMSFYSAARVAGVSLRHFRRVYDGKFVKIGKKFFIARQDLEQWMKERSPDSAERP